MKPTLKAIHICNSPQTTLPPKIAKENVFAKQWLRGSSPCWSV